ncbi:hypothetical protein AcW1_000980 [Taiwanofungus camphoratus]|nr:hypothetical protein AcW2_000524 [Antrodia cinnamomea]KAI0936850.1 hypothetical protein AcV5_004884 [Antrodia cinnamomea]KAI0964075.1 hypothetical protein AcW1_000980 [Antrodia cinnamomea]
MPSYSTHSSPVRASVQIPPPIVPSENLSNDSEIDFSPSIGTIPLHPVPSSSNGGATLDWTGLTSEDEKTEKRWILPIHKRRHKEKYPPLSTRTIVEKQDTLYADKLAQIRNKAKTHTLRKAAITGDQLLRRYNILLAPTTLHAPGINLLNVCRWYDKQDLVIKTSLDRVEPLTWLKHLWDKRGRRISRPPWYVTALIVEEYAKYVGNHQLMTTIPEDEVTRRSSPTATSFPETVSPSSGSWSWSPPHQALEPSLSRKRSSNDAQISFEPLIESGRESGDGDSQPSNKGPNRYWKYSLPNGSDSARSSVYSGHVIGSSPAGSHYHLREFARRMRRRANGNEEMLSSSARNSVSEHSVSEDGNKKSSKAKSCSRPTSRQSYSRNDSGSNEEQMVLEPHNCSPSSHDGLRTATHDQFPLNSASEHTPRLGASLQQAEVSSPPRVFLRRGLRTSLPSSDRIHVKERDQRQQEVDEDKERQDYERRTQILEDTISHNYRTRHILQRVSASIKEYDAVQSSLSAVLGVPYQKIPLEVLEAFAHDPCAVTSRTRNSGGWNAVEEVHDRIRQQRKTLRVFADSVVEEQEYLAVTRNVFDDPITSLTESLDQLELHRQHIISQAERVMETLIAVKEVHRDVKKEYNDTLSHTSLVYPELSQIEALEESYRNHYQQFWDFGLDALTLLLDTVTPFWRNYGKVIGEDVQDFLIIPWYRNEFTGESKRYPIKRFPRRSFRHWCCKHTLLIL